MGDSGAAERKTAGPGGAKPQSLPLNIPAEELGKTHRFWDSQPVPAVSDAAPESCEPIDDSRDLASIRTKPIPLPEGFDWVDVDTSSDQELQEVYTLLRDHYVEDDGACFRFEYSIDCLRWALNVPHMRRAWSVGVRSSMKSVADPTLPPTRKLVAFISGIPIRVNVHGNSFEAGEINFLCVHKSLRSRRLAPVLIKEITRRINLENIWQALYTAGVFIPRPVTDCRFFHRPLNFSKLVKVGFSSLRSGQSLEEAERDLALPADFTVEGVRAMTPADVPAVTRLMHEGFVRDQIKLFIEMDETDVAYWLLPRDGVVQTFVRESGSNGDVTDFFSYYLLPSTILRHREEHKTLFAAYSFYANGTTLSRQQLLEQTCIAAKANGQDVLNALDLHHNLPAFRTLRFGPGDGSLKYYLYNYKCPLIQPAENAVILL